MVYGYNGGGIGSYKGALGNDAAASERYRIDAAKKEMERQQRDRAKMQLADVKRKHEHNKLQISHLETDARRLESEIVHGEREVQDMQRVLKELEEKEHNFKGRVGDSTVHAKELEKKIQALRMESDKKTHEANLLEMQINHIQQKLNSVKAEISSIGSEIQKHGLEIKQLETGGHKSALDAERAKSEKIYKQKDLDNKQRAVNFLKEKKTHEVSEAQKLKTENMRLEVEIRALEQKAR